MHSCFGVPEVHVATGGAPLEPPLVPPDELGATVGPGAGVSGGREPELGVDGVPGPPVHAANVSAIVEETPIAARILRSSARDHFRWFVIDLSLLREMVRQAGRSALDEP
jgi:hypothetical protein